MPDVALLFPPGTDPRSPYLALPSLAAHLRKAGVRVRLYDLDISGFHSLMSPLNLRRAATAFRSRGVDVINRSTPLERLALVCEKLEERATEALTALRNPEIFYDPNKFSVARETLYDALDLVSAATGDQVRYSISPVRYDVAGVSTQKLADLIAVTADDRYNIFSDHWEDDLYPQLRLQRPDVVGITITNGQQMIPGLTLARRLKERGYFVVIGGALFAKFADRLRSLPEFFFWFADGVVPYEGETALLSLVDVLNTSREFSSVPNYLFVENGVVRGGPIHVEDVDSLPCPDFDGLPLGQYLTPELVLPTYIGKGCYFNRCKFCDIPYINHISKKSYRIRSVEHVVSDLLSMQRQHGCRHFEFTDEALPPRTLECLADALQPYESENFRFVGYARLEPTLTEDVCTKISRMGFRKLYFGLESGSQETLDHMDKGIRVCEVPKILSNLSNAGIRCHLFAIVGFPEENEPNARKTFEFLKDNAHILNHPGNSFDIHPFGLELRTSYFREADLNGAMINPDVLLREFVVGVGSEWKNARGLSADQVEALLNEFCLALRRIYSRYHACTQHLWPAFEEFAVLYADRYEQREFVFRASLPDDEDRHLYRLHWNPAAHIQAFKAEFFLIRGRNGDALMDAKTFKLIQDTGFQTSGDLVRSLASSVPEANDQSKIQFVRNTINSLIERGLLQIQPYFDSHEVSHVQSASLVSGGLFT
jgi:anaerobic magnesium-protoporphyrin IX monomethyl ester cyclase